MRSITASACALLAALALAACGERQEPEIGPSTSAQPPTTSTGPTTTTTKSPGVRKERCVKAESPPNITRVISHGTDCGAVVDAMAKLRSVSRDFRIGDFQCTRASGARLSGTWECRGEANYFTFEFAD